MLLAALAAWGWMRPREAAFMNRYALFLRANEAVAAAALGGHVAISPDGRRIVYMGRGEGATRLWVKDPDQVSPTPLQGTDGASSPFFSPDGRQLGFVKDGKTVRILPLEGGSPLTLTDSANATAADWGSDGYVYFEVDSGISRIRATGGRAETVYKFPPADHVIGAEWPIVLPGCQGTSVPASQGGAERGGLRDPGDAAAEGRGARTSSRHLRAICGGWASRRRDG